jgi:adenylate cyclase
MPDIFISYSSKDREQADLLTELLASAGLSVWIDKSALNAASSWSKEIVQAINECRVFVVLLSPSSLESHNVIKEVSLASEKRKKILPLDLEPVQLTEDFEYQLAGIQRAPMTNIDAIIRALGKLGLEATGAPVAPKIVKQESDGRKSLMILPFEDLSPTGDNGWFADGIVNELIAALSNVKSLRVADQQATKDYKRYTGTLPNYAREMSIRYFIQGDVRKFGDQIKITSSLLDIESGDHLWQDSLRGEMKDIFEIQESVAKKVVEGLKIHLASDEKQKLAERGTQNAEAYEFFMKAKEYFARGTKEAQQIATQLYSEAVALDPGYIHARVNKANALASLYRVYDRDPKLLEQAFAILQDVKRMKPDFLSVNDPLALILALQGKLEEAERTALDYVQNAPQHYNSHRSLGFFYVETGQHAKAIGPYEESLRLAPDDLMTISALTDACAEANENEKKRHWAEIAIPMYRKMLRLFPDDEETRVSYAILLYNAGREEEAKATARELDNLRDGRTLYNTAYLLMMLKDYPSSLAVFRKAIEAGFRWMQGIETFLDRDGIVSLEGTTEYEEVKAIVKKIKQEVDRSA